MVAVVGYLSHRTAGAVAEAVWQPSELIGARRWVRGGVGGYSWRGVSRFISVWRMEKITTDYTDVPHLRSADMKNGKR